MNLCGDILQATPSLPALQFGTIKPIITWDGVIMVIIWWCNSVHHLKDDDYTHNYYHHLCLDGNAPESRDFQDRQQNHDQTLRRLQEKY